MSRISSLLGLRVSREQGTVNNDKKDKIDEPVIEVRDSQGLRLKDNTNKKNILGKFTERNCGELPDAAEEKIVKRGL